MAQLGIEHVVIDGCLEIDVAVDVHTDETACAGGVGEWHLLVGGADERCVTAVTLVGLAVGRTIVQFGCRDEILQHNLLPLGNLVELVEIDERKRGETEVQV